MARPRRATGRKIDYKQWSFIPSLQASVTAASTVVGGALSFLVPATILRIRGYVQVSLDATKQVGDRMDVTFGLARVSTDAFDLGATAMPDPADEPEFPWFWWGSMTLRAEATGGEESWGTVNQRLEVDTKVMRKMKPAESLVWVFQSANPAGAPVTIVSLGLTRVLIGT